MAILERGLFHGQPIFNGAKGSKETLCGSPVLSGFFPSKKKIGFSEFSVPCAVGFFPPGKIWASVNLVFPVLSGFFLLKKV